MAESTRKPRLGPPFDRATIAGTERERRAGHARLQEMEARQRELQNIMLSRIDGVIQALEELLGEYEELPAPMA